MNIYDFNDLVNENFEEISKLKYPYDEITKEDIIEYYKLDETDFLHEYLINNIDVLLCLYKVEDKHETYKHLRINLFSEDDKEEFTVKNVSLKPTDIIKINVPIDNDNKLKKNNLLYIHKSQIRICGNCKRFDSIKNICKLRKLNKKEHYPACILFKYDYKKNIDNKEYRLKKMENKKIYKRVKEIV